MGDILKTFSPPRFIFYGERALELLTGHASNFGWKRALVVTDRTIERLGFAREVAAALEGKGIAVRVFTEAEPRTDFRDRRKGRRGCR